MPHALIVAFGDQKSAWAAFDQVMPPSVPRIALIDTYSDEKQEALLAAQVLGKRLEGIRLDSPSSRRGNLVDLVREIRWELDLRGFKKVQIIVSGGIDEVHIPALVAAGVQGFGVGTAISNAATIDFAMDLVEFEGRPCAKRGKFGGRKTPWACPRCLQFRVKPTAERAIPLHVRCPRCKRQMKPMFQPVLKKGKRLGVLPTAKAIRENVLKQLKQLGSKVST